MPVLGALGIIIGSAFAVLHFNKNRSFDRFEVVKLDGLDRGETSPATAETWNVEIASGLIIEMSRPEGVEFARGAQICAAIFVSPLGTYTAAATAPENC